jgi:spermidine synthase
MKPGSQTLPDTEVRRLTASDHVAVVCFFFSGFLALAFQICWIRKASVVLGATTPALSTVLAVFFAGLALGSYLFGRYTLSARRPIRVYALLEAGVGLLVLLSPAAFAIADRGYGRFYPLVYENFGLLSLLRFALVLLIVLPPTVLMGGTLPLFCRQYVTRNTRISRSVGLLYGINTLGAACGTAVCGLFLIPAIGIDRTLLVGAAVNIVMAAIVWRLPIPAVAPSSELPSPVNRREDNASVPRARNTRVIHGLFFAVGFTALAYEVLWARYLSLLMKNTVHTYTLTLSVVLLGIVLGSVLAGGWFDRTERRALLFGLVQVATGLTVLTVLLAPASWWAEWVDSPRWLARATIIVLVMLPPAILSGAAFPLAVRMAVSRTSRVGLRVGSMTAANTFGGIAGSLAAGFLLLPRFGIETTLRTTTGLSLLVGFAAWLLLARDLDRPRRIALVVASIAAWVGIPYMTGTRLPADFLAPRDELVEFREGLGAPLAVVRKPDKLELQIDRLWQGESVKTHQIMAAHMPMLLHRDPKQVLVIGLGVGLTAGRFLHYPVERVDCVEIERRLVPLVERHFEADWMGDERFRFIFEDGRNYVAHTASTYDVISIEVGQVFRPSVASFYTVEFYRAARERLRPGGLVSQFVSIPSLSPENFRMVVRSFLEVFPDATLWYNTSEFLLIGTVDGDLRLRPERIALIEHDPAIHDDLAFAYWGGPAHWLNRTDALSAGFLMGADGLADLARDAPDYHDDRPRLEYATPPRDPEPASREIVALVRQHLEPTARAFAVPPDEATLESSLAIRERNLDDVSAKLLQQRAESLLAEGKRQEFMSLLQETLRRNPERVKARNNLGGALLQDGRAEEAIREFRLALEVRPDYASAHNNLGSALASTGRFDEAVQHYRSAVTIEPGKASTHYDLARALGSSGALEEAAVHYRRCIELQPEFTQAHFDLGALLHQAGRTDDALARFRNVLEIDPDSTPALTAVAAILISRPEPGQDDTAEAIRLAERAARLTNDRDPAVLEVLAAAYARGGRFDEAVSVAQRALSLVSGNPALAGRFRMRLESYRGASGAAD